MHDCSVVYFMAVNCFNPIKKMVDGVACNTFFMVVKVEFVLERRVVCLLDALVVAKMYKNRSDAVQHAVEWFFTKRG